MYFPSDPLICGRTGSANVGTISGLPFCTISATGSASELGLPAQNPLLTEVERTFPFPPGFLLPVVGLLPVGLAFPVFRRKLGPPVYAT